MKKLSWLIVAVLVMLMACAPTATEGYVTIGLDEVLKQQDDGLVIVDVREVEEFAEGHIGGAINVPLSELKKGNRANLDAKETYIIICRSGNRSKDASDILFEEGYDVVNVSEGMSTWTREVE